MSRVTLEGCLCKSKKQQKWLTACMKKFSKRKGGIKGYMMMKRLILLT